VVLDDLIDGDEEELGVVAAEAEVQETVRVTTTMVDTLTTMGHLHPRAIASFTTEVNPTCRTAASHEMVGPSGETRCRGEATLTGMVLTITDLLLDEEATWLLSVVTVSSEDSTPTTSMHHLPDNTCLILLGLLNNSLLKPIITSFLLTLDPMSNRQEPGHSSHHSGLLIPLGSVGIGTNRQ